ncbi:MAG: NAD/NADP octopine/nopaline dehydrogenase family protein [Bacillota bacterium]
MKNQRKQKPGERRVNLFPLGSHHSFPRFSIIGAGNGGMAMAGHLALAGFPVKLFNRNPAKLAGVIHEGGIRLKGQIEGFAHIPKVTSDPREAVADADVLMVVVPASGHRVIAKILAPYLKDGQIVVLNPGRTLGALEFEHIIVEAGCQASVVVAEAQSLLYASRITNAAEVTIFGIKNTVPVAAIPAWQTERVTKILNLAFPQFIQAAHVLQTSLDNVGAVLHPAPTILNMARIESGETFEYYHQGITPRIARIVEQLDQERLSIAKALGLETMSTKEWLEKAYGATGEDLYEAILNNVGYSGILAPSSMPTRYITEDVPTGLVPLAALGELTGVATPTINSLINMASFAEGADYWTEGRSLQNLGLAGKGLEEIFAYILEGREGLFPRVSNV